MIGFFKINSFNFGIFTNSLEVTSVSMADTPRVLHGTAGVEEAVEAV